MKCVKTGKRSASNGPAIGERSLRQAERASAGEFATFVAGEFATLCDASAAENCGQCPRRFKIPVVPRY